MANPQVDKNGTVYGIPFGQNSSGSYVTGPNLLAYGGNTLKWKYPVSCSSSQESNYVVGANGNIYATMRLSSGDVRLIGLTPEVASGQTQPTKVLDVDIPNDCSIELFPYKDGLMLHGQSSGNPRYYSYSGKLLTQATIGDYWFEKLNDQGQLFTYSYVYGSYTSISVSMFDPRTGSVAWTTSASTPGAGVKSETSLYPLPNGGVVALLKEQRMLASGVPASPTEYVYTLAAINASGVKLPSPQLSNTSTQPSGTLGTARAAASGDGKIVVIRDLKVNTNLASPTTAPALAFGVYDPTSTTWTYQVAMQGDLQKTGGPNGYITNFGPVLANNTLFVLAACRGNCGSSGTGTKLYPVIVSGLGMDYPRGAVLTANTPAQPVPVPLVALGDSYSSGQGAGEYDPNTTTANNKCYQSKNAYGNVLNRDPYSKFALQAFVACGGAVTSNITTNTTYPDVSSAQKYAVDSTTQIATLTIGGNDIRFAGVIEDCAYPDRDCNAAFNTASAKIDTSFYDNLQAAYLAILSRNSTVKLHVLGYPPIFARGSSGCFVGDNGGSYPFFGPSRIDKGLQLLDSLNTAIENNVDAMKTMNNGVYAQRIEYIPATSSNSPFNGYEVCSSPSYINGLITGNTSESFHPNQPGHGAYASLIKANS